jgi:hypothetical protein
MVCSDTSGHSRFSPGHFLKNGVFSSKSFSHFKSFEVDCDNLRGVAGPEFEMRVFLEETPVFGKNCSAKTVRRQKYWRNRTFPKNSPGPKRVNNIRYSHAIQTGVDQIRKLHSVGDGRMLISMLMGDNQGMLEFPDALVLAFNRSCRARAQ